MQGRAERTSWRRARPGPPCLCLLVVAGLALAVALVACSSPTQVQCVAWYDAPNHIGEETCVEGCLHTVHEAGTNPQRFAYFLFDPSFTRIEDGRGAFYAWVVTDDWCQYFPSCDKFSGELDGTCMHVFGTIERYMGQARIEVTDRSQVEFIDCFECQIPEACTRIW